MTRGIGPARSLRWMIVVIAITVAVVGLLIGSFANVAIHRWPRGGSLNDTK